MATFRVRVFPAAWAEPAIARRQKTVVAETRAIIGPLLPSMLKTSLLTPSSYKRRATALCSGRSTGVPPGVPALGFRVSRSNGKLLCIANVEMVEDRPRHRGRAPRGLLALFWRGDSTIARDRPFERNGRCIHIPAGSGWRSQPSRH